MGTAVIYQCEECGHRFYAAWGRGCNSDYHFRKVARDVRSGKYGGEWKERLLGIRGGVVDGTLGVYLCVSCGWAGVEPDLGLYEPKDPGARYPWYGDFRDLEEEFRLKWIFPHRCGRCGEVAYLVPETDQLRLKCPECREGDMVCDPPGSYGIWD